jgi:glucokinase
MRHVLGIDVGGTAIKHALVDQSGGLSRFGSTPTPEQDPEATALIPAIARIVDTYAQETPHAVGVAIPGIVTAAGVAEFSSTLGFRNLDMLALLRDAISIPVFLVHDVTAGGIAEATTGAARGEESAVLIQIGTALAASVIVRGEVYHPHPAIGEIGHAPTVFDRPCPCGLRGCLEMSASGGAVSRNYEQLTGDKVSAEVIFQRAELGDSDARDVHVEFLESLGFALAWISALLGPDVIVISGGMSIAGEPLLGHLESQLDQRLSVHKRPRLALSRLADSAGCAGAGIYAWRGLT